MLENFKHFAFECHPQHNSIIPKTYAREVALCPTDFVVYDASIPEDKQYLHKSERRYLLT